MNTIIETASLKIPEYDLYIVPGMTIRIGRFNHTEWIVGYGWYAWGGNRPVYGWYLTDMLSKTIKPLQYTDLEDVYIVGDAPTPGPDPDPAVLVEKIITENGIYNAASDDADGYSKVSVNVLPTLMPKTVTKNITYTAKDDGVEGYSSVTVSVGDIAIDSLTALPELSEKGSSQTVTLLWSLNKPAITQDVNGHTVTGTTTQFTDVTADTTYVLTVNDGYSSASKSVSVSFANRVYYGAAADLTSVTSLSSVLSNDPERTITVNAGAGQYIIYAIPERLGDVTFFVSGFEGGFEEPVVQVLTNSSGFTENYLVYRSTNANLGETTVEIKEA